jgi:hypothetical protein
VGTKFYTMLAPINAPTGDGRRFATGGIELAPTPFPFEWVRSREGGHDGAVTVGAVQETVIATVAEALSKGWVTQDEVKEMGLDRKSEAIWAIGVMFDDVDREELPTLAEDVAHAMHLIEQRTLGPSVDLDSFEGIPVKAGTDEEVTWADIEEAEMAGEEIKLELLITAGRVRAGTLVSIPAFVETSRPLRLEAEEPAEAAVSGTAALIAALVASSGRAPAAALFDLQLTGPTPITYDWENGWVFGHIALNGTCHSGFSDVCITPPEDPSGAFSWFNRFPVETQDGGLIWAGRLTLGGRHADLSLTASGAMAVHDRKTTVAYVRAAKDEFGIKIVGPLDASAVDARGKAILERRKVSGDWRETPDGLSLVEVLALGPGPRQHSEPGFPVATHVSAGRQTALVASLGPDPDGQVMTFGADVAGLVKAELDRREAQAALRKQVEDEDSALAAEARAALAELLGQQGEE